MQFNGSLIVPHSGDYHIWLGSDDGSRLFLDGQLVLDNGGLVRRPLSFNLTSAVWLVATAKSRQPCSCCTPICPLFVARLPAACCEVGRQTPHAGRRLAQAQAREGRSRADLPVVGTHACLASFGPVQFISNSCAQLAAAGSNTFSGMVQPLSHWTGTALPRMDARPFPLITCLPAKLSAPVRPVTSRFPSSSRHAGVGLVNHTKT